jgi:hypothetical protein
MFSATLKCARALGWFAPLKEAGGYMNLANDTSGLQRDLVRLRRELHQEPEVGLHLPRTQQRVPAALEGLPLEVFDRAVAVVGDRPAARLRRWRSCRAAAG